MYIILFCLIILVFGKFRIRFKAAVAGIAAFLFAIVSIVLPNYYYPKANIVPGGGQAAFAMPIELLGRSAHAYPQDVTDSEKEIHPDSRQTKPLRYVIGCLKPIFNHTMRKSGVEAPLRNLYPVTGSAIYGLYCVLI